MNENVNVTLPREGEKERTLAEEVAIGMQRYGDRVGNDSLWVARFYDVLASRMAARYLSKGIDSIDEKEIMLLQAVGYSLIAGSIPPVELGGVEEELGEIKDVLDRKLKK